MVRIDKLERGLQPEGPPVAFARCSAPEGLSPERHEQYHTERGQAGSR